MNTLFIFTIVIFKTAFVVNADLGAAENRGLDQNLFEDVLDPELCDEQINYIVNNDTLLLLTFLDAGFRMPKGIIAGNTLDLGNYYQCLNIHQAIPNSVVEGKYCMIDLPLNQDINLPDLPLLPEFPWPEFNLTSKILNDKITNGLKSDNEQNVMSSLTLNVAICLPKVCTTERVLNTLGGIGFQYEERFCRLPNDKPWVTADYIAIAIFSVLILLVILSTVYDISHNILLEKDPKKINKILVSFSAYTNTRNLVTYKSSPGVVECLDGIRTLAMVWVILGHAFIYQFSNGLTANLLDAIQWILTARAMWATSAPITVDTFFMLSGFLVVYTTCGKITSIKLLKSLHLFYLNRLLRIFPVLAAMVLIQASFMNWIADGPLWDSVINNVEQCRTYWWTTLLHIQNYYNPHTICISSTWYLAVDVQLYILCPIILVWVLSGRRSFAWVSLIGGLLAVLTASTIYNFINAFPSAQIAPARQSDHLRYASDYYVNTLTRASPFLVGLVFGYILHIFRGKKVVMMKIIAILLWICALTIIILSVYSGYPILQLDWDNQFADNMINSFMRPAWAMALGWIIFACEHGYGGPINWFLSLKMWKLLSRLSFAMYITHDGLINVMYAMPVTPVYFTVPFTMLKFLTIFSMAFLFAFVITILVDSPCTVLIKYYMGSGIKKHSEKPVQQNNDDKISVEKQLE